MTYLDNVATSHKPKVRILIMDYRVVASEHARIGSVNARDRLAGVPVSPLSKASFVCKLGWLVFWAIAVALAYVVTAQMRDLPEIVFYPILAAVVLLLALLKVWLIPPGLSLHLDSRTARFGPIWARRRIPFGEIVAIQLLTIAAAFKSNGKRDAILYEINIVLATSGRLPFARHKVPEKAHNIAYTVSDIVKAPVIEQFSD